jgi:hypothetical protein
MNELFLCEIDCEQLKVLEWEYFGGTMKIAGSDTPAAITRLRGVDSGPWHVRSWRANARKGKAAVGWYGGFGGRNIKEEDISHVPVTATDFSLSPV